MAAVNPVNYQAQNASAKAQMDFQERMSNTAHQREVEDLKKAGLNPVLSAHGSGASTPEGAEGYVGDDNARLFDLVTNAMNQSAKTLSKAVGSLGRALSKDTTSGFTLKDFLYKNPRNPQQQLWNMGMTLMDPYVQNGTVRGVLNSIPGYLTSGYSVAQTYLNNHKPSVPSLPSVNSGSPVSVPVISLPDSIATGYADSRGVLHSSQSSASRASKPRTSHTSSAKTVAKNVIHKLAKVVNWF